MKASLLDPRSKLFVSLAAMIAMILAKRTSFFLWALGILFAGVWQLGLFRPWLGLLKGLGAALAGFFIIAWIAFDTAAAVQAALRLLGISMIFFLYFQTTAPEALANSLIKIRVPYSLAFVLSASLQFVQVLARKAANIRDAQRARGIPLEGPWGTVRHLPALAGPLLIQAFKFADELAEAMEARGFGAPGRRFRKEPRFAWLDWLAVIGSGSGLVVFLFLVY
jgi:energy-coupling factor transport system permease protein